MTERSNRFELKFARLIGRSAVDAQLIFERLKLKAITQMSLVGCGRTGLGYAFHDHQVPEAMKLRALDKAKVWVLDEKSGKYVPHDPKRHGKFGEFNLPEEEQVVRAPRPPGTTAVHRHNGKHRWGVYEYDIVKKS